MITKLHGSMMQLPCDRLDQLRSSVMTFLMCERIVLPVQCGHFLGDSDLKVCAGLPVRFDIFLTCYFCAGVAAGHCNLTGFHQRARHGPRTAYHFLRHDDVRRLDINSILQSLAFQLARRCDCSQGLANFRRTHICVSMQVSSITVMPGNMIVCHDHVVMYACSFPHVCAHLTASNTMAKIIESSSIDKAFEAPLLEPLRLVTEEVVLLIDAVDDADLPEQQVAGYRGPPALCGNAMVPLIFKHLVCLPRNVRFIFTTRPGAGGARGGIEGVLVRTFSDASITFVEPQRLRGAGWEAEPLLSTVITSCSLPKFKSRDDTYREAFERQRKSLYQAGNPGWGSACRLLSVLLAAQEPLPHVLLQRMGLYGTREHLPGWGVLFYEAEHHVYLLHKTLTDGMRKHSKNLGVSVDQGHELLGKRLTAMALREPPPPSYALRHLVHHLTRVQACEVELRACLADDVFLAAVFAAGHGSGVVRSLGSVAYTRTLPIYDAWRWLCAWQHNIASRPADITATRLACPTVTREFAQGQLSTRLLRVLRGRTDLSDRLVAVPGRDESAVTWL
jgi:hypothetical protein